MTPEPSSALVAISGGLGDIGRAVADAFGRTGAQIALGDLAPHPPHVVPGFYQALDVSDAQSVEAWYDAVEAHYGRVPDRIIVNAATATFRRILEISPAEWQREIDVNLNGAFHFARAGAARLVRRGLPGSMVMVGSWAAEAPHPALPAYSVAKAGLRMLNRTLALELAPHGIRVNELAPGYVNAGLSGRIFAENPALAETARQQTPLGLLIDAEAVAAQVLYLCSAQAAAITGSTLLQDGGLSLLQGPPANA